MELEFTPPASHSTRLSADVWQLICSHAARNGNSSTREALEQLIRRTLGNAQVVQLGCIDDSPAAASPAPTSAPTLSGNAAAALDAVLQS